jgi:8-oxo-dGTP pyrophosphatase MutT (NUDIX family)
VIAEQEALRLRLDRIWLEERFAHRRGVPAAPELPAGLAGAFGDHELNADMQPVLPLKPAAVLVPVVDRPDHPTVLLTQRTAHLAHHAGQVSFPGGHIEPGDNGPAETALRETEEEVGLDRRHVRLIGHLDIYITRTGFVVTPVIGIVTPPFALTPDAHEVADVFEVPLAFLMDPANHHRCTATFEGTERHFYAMPYGRHFIWGATAGMLMNLYRVLAGQR